MANKTYPGILVNDLQSGSRNMANNINNWTRNEMKAPETPAGKPKRKVNHVARRERIWAMMNQQDTSKKQ